MRRSRSLGSPVKRHKERALYARRALDSSLRKAHELLDRENCKAAYDEFVDAWREYGVVQAENMGGAAMRLPSFMNDYNKRFAAICLRDKPVYQLGLRKRRR